MLCPEQYSQHMQEHILTDNDTFIHIIQRYHYYIHIIIIINEFNVAQVRKSQHNCEMVPKMC